MRVLFVTSEIYPYVKTGGLGDVAGVLPVALARKKIDIRLALPGYPSIIDNLDKVRVLRHLPDFFGKGDARILLGKLPNGLLAYVLDAPAFYSRAGIYLDGDGKDWTDNHLRFAALSRMAADISFYDDKWQADVVHGNDWQAGLMPAYLAWRGAPRPRTVMTVHNLAYQGLFPYQVLEDLMLPHECFSVNGAEFYGKLGFLKAGLYYADALTTVSPTYAEEIKTRAYGCGLDGLLRHRSNRLFGILNGIDQNEWNPKTDKGLAENYSAAKLDGRIANKKALIAEWGLKKTRLEDPIFAVVSRLTSQKGLSLLLDALPPLLKTGLRLVVLGTGDRDLEARFTALAAKHKGQVSIHLGYDESRAHRILAGADAVVIPSLFEPCGLVQLYGMHYGALPIVRKTGGLADSVTDGETGFVFEEPTATALGAALMRALAAFKTPRQWTIMQKKAMKADFGWDASAENYISLYAALMGAAPAGRVSPAST